MPLVEAQFVLWGAVTAASALPINPLLNAEEIAHVCRAAAAKALVALGPLSGTEMWDKAKRVKALVPTLGVLIQMGGREGQLADLLRSSPPQLALPNRPGPRQLVPKHPLTQDIGPWRSDDDGWTPSPGW